jgi:hypothetical protein
MENNIFDELLSRIKLLEAKNTQLKEQLATTQTKLAHQDNSENNYDNEIEGK